MIPIRLTIPSTAVMEISKPKIHSPSIEPNTQRIADERVSKAKPTLPKWYSSNTNMTANAATTDQRICGMSIPLISESPP